MKMINIRNKLFARKKKQPAHAKTIKLYNMFRNREIKKSKDNYYNNYFESHSNDIMARDKVYY